MTDFLLNNFIKNFNFVNSNLKINLLFKTKKCILIFYCNSKNKINFLLEKFKINPLKYLNCVIFLEDSFSKIVLILASFTKKFQN